MRWWRAIRAALPVRRPVVAGVDVGSEVVRVALGTTDDNGTVKVVGRGEEQSRGMRLGYIVNRPLVTRSVARALARAIENCGEEVMVRGAYVGVGGEGLDELLAHGEVLVGSADQTITKADIHAAQERAREAHSSELLNRVILHTVPLRYTINGAVVPTSSVEGMRGSRLGIDYLFITAIEKHVSDLEEAVSAAGMPVEGLFASPLAAAYVSLNRQQRTIGAVLANIGAQTLSIAVFENDIPISVKVFPIGASAITRDIAIALKVDPTEADRLLRRTRAATDEHRETARSITLRHAEAMFRLIDRHLATLGKQGLLAGGIVITGGGAALREMEEVAQQVLQLPTRTIPPLSPSSLHLRDGSWSVAHGLLTLGVRTAGGSPTLAHVRKPLHEMWQVIRGYLP